MLYHDRYNPPLELINFSNTTAPGGRKACSVSRLRREFAVDADKMVKTKFVSLLN